MKKIITPLLLAASFMYACTEQELIDDAMPQQISLSGIRSYSEALEIAQHSISMLNGSSETRGDSHVRRIASEGDRVFVSCGTTRSNIASGDTLIYVFNFEDNEGFALVSASKYTDGLLAVTEKGFCNPDTSTGIEGFDQFVEMSKIYVANSLGHILPPPDSVVINIKDSIVYDRSYVGPYLSVCWGKSNPEGELFNNGIAGCTNRAMAQIMSYYEYPSSITLTYDNADINIQNLNWSLMKAHSVPHTIDQCSDTVTHKAISRFFRQLGKLTNSDDSNPTGTSTSSSMVRPALIALGYNVPQDQFVYYSSSSVRNEINNGRLVLMGGHTEDGLGHAWVMDGYMTEVTTTYMMRQIGIGPWIIYDGPIVRTNLYNHFNWGWYGENNGYFLEDVFNTSYVYLPDTSNNTINFNFNRYVQYLSVYH